MNLKWKNIIMTENNKHKLSNTQKSVIDTLINYKEKSKTEATENYFILTASIQSYIYRLDVSPTSKLLLIYLLSKIDYGYRHLYIHASYSIIFKETTIKKPTAIICLKELNEKKSIELLSGTHRIRNTIIKEFIFNQKQNTYDNNNQTNIVDMTPFFETFFKAVK